ncbi:MAG: zinc-ribbon domain-containing protein [Bacteroidetes bacterium]|nr:zinc-ribbon domain-containing protein [Bacteroidota bacterium]
MKVIWKCDKCGHEESKTYRFGTPLTGIHINDQHPSELRISITELHNAQITTTSKINNMENVMRILNLKTITLTLYEETD